MGPQEILPIQFVGTQRSGSNLLRVILNQFTEISAPHPPHILKTFYPMLHLYGDLNHPNNFKRLVIDVCEWVNVNPVPWDIKFDYEMILSRCRENSLIEILKYIYQQKAEHDNARYWCCKSMESIYYYKEVEAKLSPIYIHLVRDGRDVALSFSKAFVGPKHVYFLAEKWKKEQEISLNLKAIVSPDRFIEVRYEELIQSPEAIIRHICSKLKIEYSDVALDFFHSSESVVAAKSGPMWTNLTHPIMADNHDKFRQEFKSDQLLIFEKVAGSMLNQLGYKTIFWTPALSETFTEEELTMFKEEDQYLRKQAMLKADPVEISNRKAQDNLYQEIISRKPIPV